METIMSMLKKYFDSIWFMIFKLIKVWISFENFFI